MADLQDHEAQHRYFTQVSRLEETYRVFPEVLNFKDGQCFLDLGCGTGQNIRFLSKNFPESRIVGIDVNPHALGMIHSVEANSNVELRLGDLTQEATTELAQELAPDHIVLSHVLEHVVGDSVLSTKRLRLQIVRDITTAAACSVVIIDAKENLAPFRARFEQATRLSVQDDLTSYFEEIKGGRLLILPVGDSNTFVFSKN